jgi:Ser/Thr protein kinase RdoA (MazF antagonist)
VTLDPAAWLGVDLIEPVAEGNRNEVWRGVRYGEMVSVRRSRRSVASLDWELDLIEHLDSAGFRVATVVPTADGRRHVDGVVVQRWLTGRPPESTDDWRRVADVLQAIHTHTAGYPQRPGCCAVAELTSTGRSVDADLAALPADVVREVLAVFATAAHLPRVVIHGDPMAGNLRLGEDGVVGLLDFDESRVDVAWHDLSNLGVQVLADADHSRALRLSDAWETTNAWVSEPAYARTRLASLRSRR